MNSKIQNGKQLLIPCRGGRNFTHYALGDLINKMMHLPTINIQNLEDISLKCFIEGGWYKEFKPLHRINIEEYKRIKK